MVGDTSSLDTTLEHYYSDRIYLVYTPETIVFWGKEYSLEPSVFSELRGRIVEYEITGVENTFFFSTSEYLSRVLTVYFNRTDLLENLLSVLNGEEQILLAERVPIMRQFITPNDPSYGNQWALNHINCEQAWDITTGSSQIKVAVVDDAIQTNHPDLNSAIFSSYNVIGGGSNASPPNDLYDHGTHVAGIVSAQSNNSIGVSSIGYGNVKIIAIKASNGTINPDGPGVLITHAYAGISWAVQFGANIINCSWGGGGWSSVNQQVLTEATAQAIVVAAAGNDNTNTIQYPAGYANVIAVASSINSDEKSEFSNYGSWVDVTAPGSSIFSTTINSTYGWMSGTSMASPLVAGLMGLVWSVNPALNKETIIGCVLSSASPISWAGGGSGRIDAHAAVACATISNTWVDQTYAGFENGAFYTPFNTLIEGVNAVQNGGNIYIKSSSSNATPLIDVNKTFTIRTWNGSSTIGQ